MRPGTTTFVKAVPRCKEAERDGNACGWIVDLRQNSGGIVWPMFAVAAPLLGEGKAGSSALPDGTSTPWYVENRRPSLSGKKSPLGTCRPGGDAGPSGHRPHHCLGRRPHRTHLRPAAPTRSGSTHAPRRHRHGPRRSCREDRNPVAHQPGHLPLTSLAARAWRTRLPPSRLRPGLPEAGGGARWVVQTVDAAGVVVRARMAVFWE